ncbi:MAG: hypothetical protein Q9209_007514 [Squamulea sp. 1 TL-2023]
MDITLNADMSNIPDIDNSAIESRAASQLRQTPHSMTPTNNQGIDRATVMQWNWFSGFDGEGTYLIYNKESHTCLGLDEKSSEPDRKVQAGFHISNNLAQLWKIIRDPSSDLYVLENVFGQKLLSARGNSTHPQLILRVPFLTFALGTGEPVIVAGQYLHDNTPDYPKESLWIIDKDFYSKEAGKLVV